MGVTDPLGGINTLFPLASPINYWPPSPLTVVTVVVIKKAPVEVGPDTRYSTGMGSGGDADRLLAEDLPPTRNWATGPSTSSIATP